MTPTQDMPVVDDRLEKLARRVAELEQLVDALRSELQSFENSRRARKIASFGG